MATAVSRSNLSRMDAILMLYSEKTVFPPAQPNFAAHETTTAPSSWLEAV